MEKAAGLEGAQRAGMSGFRTHVLKPKAGVGAGRWGAACPVPCVLAAGEPMAVVHCRRG